MGVGGSKFGIVNKPGGKEFVCIESQAGITCKAEHDRDTTIKGNDILVVEQGNNSISVNVGSYELNCPAGRVHPNANWILIEGKIDIKLHCGSSSITMNQNDIELKVGASSISINAGMITIKSPMVKIN